VNLTYKKDFTTFFLYRSIFERYTNEAKCQKLKSKATKQRMIKENKYTGGFRPKFGYDVDDNGYLVPCEKEQSIVCLLIV